MRAFSSGTPFNTAEGFPARPDPSLAQKPILGSRSRHLCFVRLIHSRRVKLRFSGHSTPLLIGACYVPPSGSHNLRDNDVGSRFSTLADKISAATVEGHVLLAGDMNARVAHLEEAACAQRRGCVDTVINAHGRHLIQMCDSSGSLLCTGRTPGDECASYSYKPTARSPGSRIDHVVVSHSLYDAVAACAVSVQRLESDHHPIECTLRLDVQVVQPQLCRGIPLSRRHWQPDLRAEYCRHLGSQQCQQQLQAAMLAASAGNVHAAFQSLHSAVGQAADMSGMVCVSRRGKSARAPHQPFFDRECVQLKREVQHASNPAMKKTLERQYHSVVRSKRRKYLQRRLQDLIAQQHSQPRSFWKVLRQEHTEFPVSLQAVQAWDAYLVDVADKRQPQDCEFLQDAYPQQPLQDAECLNQPITAEEVAEGLARLHNGRAKGPQGLASEFLRYAQPQKEKGQPQPHHALLSSLTAVLNAAFSHGIVPEEYNGGLISPVFKKGDSLDTSNYRPIAVTDAIMRLYAGILNARLLRFTEDKGLRAETQAGFRPGFSTLHPVMGLQYFIDTAKFAGYPLFACALDLKGAYDRVQRPLLWQILQRLGIHGSMLAAIQSLYHDTEISININGRTGKPIYSRTGVKQGCPLSPTLFGLFADGLHRYLRQCCPHVGPALADGRLVPDLGYADDFLLLALSAEGVQQLLDSTGNFCASMGMIISVPKTKVIVFNHPYPIPYQWTVSAELLEIVSQIKYLGVIFTAQGDFSPTFGHLRRNMCAAWALLKRQYGRLQCLSSVGLLFRLYMACVPTTASYACEIWGPYRLTARSAAARQQLSQAHIHMLREIAGVRRCAPTSVLLAEFGLRGMPDQWLLRAAGFWNSLAALPQANLYRHIALDACRAAISSNHRNWAHSMFKAIRGTGYQLNIRCDDFDKVLVPALALMLEQRRDAIWDGLDICPRTCPSVNARLCTYAQWFARPVGRHARSLLDLQVSRRCMQRFLRFRMGCHRLPRDTGAWIGTPRLQRVCNMCAQRVIGDEKHMVFECPALQDLRDKRPHLFAGSQAGAMVVFLWQADITGVVRFIDECLERIVYTSNQP